MLMKAIGRLTLGAMLAAATLSAAQAQNETRFAAGQSWVNEDGTILAITAAGANGQVKQAALKARPQRRCTSGAEASGGRRFVL